MRNFFFILAFVLTICIGEAATRKVLQIDVSTNPSNNDTLVINGVTRTWKTSVTNPATEIAIAASAALSKTKLFLQIAANPYTGPLILQSVDADSIKLTAQVDGALTYSQTGTTWATFTLSTLTVVSAYNVRMPISVEPASTRIVIANDLVTAMASATGTFGTSDAHMANFASLTGTQTVSNKSLQTGNINSLTIRNGSTDNNTTIETSAYQGIHFNDWQVNRQFTIRPNNNGFPSIFSTYAGATVNTSVATSDGNLTNNADALLNVKSADNRYLRLTASNTATGDLTVSGDVEFQGETLITNGQGGTLTDVTIALATSIGGTIGALTGGTIASSTLTAPTMTGVVTISNAGHLVTGRYDDTTVTSGNAVLNPYNASFVKLNGINGDVYLVGIQGGVDGRILRIYNPHATYNVDVFHESSLSSTAGNRIISNTEANRAGSGGVQIITLIYDAGASRWILTNFES